MKASGYIVDTGDELIAFVRLPYDRSRWVKTHPCVLLKKCSYCNAPRGVLCMGSNSLIIQTHAPRRKMKGSDWKRAVKSIPGLAVAESLRREHKE